MDGDLLDVYTRYPQWHARKKPLQFVSLINDFAGAPDIAGQCAGT